MGEQPSSPSVRPWGSQLLSALDDFDVPRSYGLALAWANSDADSPTHNTPNANSTPAHPPTSARPESAASFKTALEAPSVLDHKKEWPARDPTFYGRRRGSRGGWGWGRWGGVGATASFGGVAIPVSKERKRAYILGAALTVVLVVGLAAGIPLSRRSTGASARTDVDTVSVQAARNAVLDELSPKTATAATAAVGRAQDAQVTVAVAVASSTTAAAAVNATTTSVTTTTTTKAACPPPPPPAIQGRLTFYYPNHPHTPNRSSSGTPTYALPFLPFPSTPIKRTTSWGNTSSTPHFTPHSSPQPARGRREPEPEAVPCTVECGNEGDVGGEDGRPVCAVEGGGGAGEFDRELVGCSADALWCCMDDEDTEEARMGMKKDEQEQEQARKTMEPVDDNERWIARGGVFDFVQKHVWEFISPPLLFDLWSHEDENLHKLPLPLPSLRLHSSHKISPTSSPTDAVSHSTRASCTFSIYVFETLPAPTCIPPLPESSILPPAPGRPQIDPVLAARGQGGPECGGGGVLWGWTGMGADGENGEDARRGTRRTRVWGWVGAVGVDGHGGGWGERRRCAQGDKADPSFGWRHWGVKNRHWNTKGGGKRWRMVKDCGVGGQEERQDLQPPVHVVSSRIYTTIVATGVGVSAVTQLARKAGGGRRKFCEGFYWFKISPSPSPVPSTSA
ncbi:hypothetical protein M427DRAFT_147094 [Gonapodya prolifera JEL478]|uniref:Uncharacterized protein n=1 Tax=Gonapodya prolifera (strain JEL478) TaxID=1344416 RepID=A0A139A6E2_GONPJ|nr:hypothetical protein M427DRAFT_147094 [Gonapodya prolifera JEL478]|eukprot:KXS12372.1 hypothetical protein M427DRAFT_147094 [Gonapodya prolifera JEL478]